MNRLTTYITKENIFIGLLVSIAFFSSSYLIGNAISHLKDANDISVSGTAERYVTSDTGKWTFSVNTLASQDDYARETKRMHDNIEIIAKYLVGRGISKEEIQVKPVTSGKVCHTQTQESYTDSGKECSGDFSYSLSQKIVVTSKKVTDIQDLSLNASVALQTQNVIIKSESVEYFYNGLNPLKTELLKEAMKNATERAKTLAESTGSKIGGLKNASQGVFQITAQESTEVSDYGSYDTSEINKKVTAVVRASFAVK
jgi:hypothetical protein